MVKAQKLCFSLNHSKSESKRTMILTAVRGTDENATRHNAGVNIGMKMDATKESDRRRARPIKTGKWLPKQTEKMKNA
jgi:hypothetical protein